LEFQNGDKPWKFGAVMMKTVHTEVAVGISVFVDNDRAESEKLSQGLDSEKLDPNGPKLFQMLFSSSEDPNLPRELQTETSACAEQFRHPRKV
jgi:hypothetical protein